MAELDIIKPLSENSRREMIDILDVKRRTKWHKAMKAFEDRAKEVCNINHKPFCYRCAKIEFEEAQKDVFKRSDSRQRFFQELKNDGLSWLEKNMPVKVNVKPYEDIDRFKFIKAEKVTESTKVNGVRVTYVTTYNAYRCVVRGCNLSIQQREELMKGDDLVSEESKKKK